MWLQRFGHRCLNREPVCYATCVVASLAAAWGLPFVSWISCVIVALITLVKGRNAGFITLVWAVTPVLALFIALRIDLREILLLQLCLVWGMALLWRRPQMSVARMIWLSLICGAVVITVFHAALAMSASVFWKHWLHQYVMPLISQAQSGKEAGVLLDQLSPYMTGIIVASLLLGGLLAVLGGYLWQQVMNNTREVQQFIGVRLGSVSIWLPLLMVLVTGLFCLFHQYNSISFFAAYWPGYWSWVQDVIPLFFVLYGLVGLSQLHALFPIGGPYRWVLYVSYVLLAFFPGYMLGILVLVVLTDGCLRGRVPLRAR